MAQIRNIVVIFEELKKFSAARVENGRGFGRDIRKFQTFKQKPNHVYRFIGVLIMAFLLFK